jgi:hypothetical protein
MSNADFTGVTWRKSTRSGGDSGMCVEVASVLGLVGIRDSKNPFGPNLALGQDAFSRLLHGIKDQ